ncbi:MAG: TerB family tellurite resistance protein [Microcoleaceae cyanobacterium MO_207.B10]|nr:TerB family tellurite resistance protein [Microcoleaceae cyanobacterium MO_207.B10]
MTLLLGIMFADGTVTDEEEKIWETTIDKFIKQDKSLLQLIQSITNGLQKNQIYTKPKVLIILTSQLSKSEKLLLISLAYEVGIADGNLKTPEQKYLQVIAKRLEIEPEYLAVLDAGFTGKLDVETKALNEVYALLNPDNFPSLEPSFAEAANQLINKLPPLPQETGNQKTLIQEPNHQKLDSYYFDINQTASKLKELVQSGLDELLQAESKLNNKPIIAAINRQKIWLQVGEFSGYYVKILELGNIPKNQAIEEIDQTWDEWVVNLEATLKEQLLTKTEIEVETTEEQSKLTKAYGNKFTRIFQNELENFVLTIINQNLGVVTQSVNRISQSIKDLAVELNIDSFGAEIISEIDSLIDTINNIVKHIHEEGLGDNSGFDVFEFVDSAVGNVFNYMGGTNTQQIKQKVFERGWKKFVQSKDKLFEKIKENIATVIDEKIDLATQMTEQAIKLYEDFLKTQARYQEETPEKQEIEKAWIREQREKLERIEKEIETVLSYDLSIWE